MKYYQLILLIIVLWAKRHHQEQSQCQGVVLDANIDSTKVYIYTWPCRKIAGQNPQIYIGQLPAVKEIKPALSSFASKLNEIPSYLGALTDFAKQQIAVDKIRYSPILLGATSGMRQILVNEQENILQRVRNFFRDSGFQFVKNEWARVLSGQEESGYLWLTVNYILFQFKFENIDINTRLLEQSYSVVEFNRIDTQIAKQALGLDDDNKADFYRAQYNGPNNATQINISVFTHSFANFGFEEALTAINQYSASNLNWKYGFQNPCFQQGYVTNVDDEFYMYGTGNPDDCRDMIKVYLNNTSLFCKYDNCGMAGTYLPQFESQDLVYIAGDVGQILNEIQKQYGTFTWVELQKGYNYICKQYWNKQKDNTKCFQGLYLETLLSYGYKIPPNTFILYGVINGLSPNWSMGILMNELNQINDYV